MKVLSITTLFPNSAQPVHGLFIRERLRHLKDLCEVRVVAPVILPPSGLSSNRNANGWSRVLGVEKVETQMGMTVYHPRIYHIPKIGVFFSGFYYFLYLYKTILKIRQEFNFDVIDAHWAYPDGFAAVLLGKKLGVPVVVSCRGADINGYTDVPVLKNLVSYTLKNCSAVITVSQGLKDKAVSAGIPESKVTVIANGVDINRFKYLPRVEARVRLGIPIDRRIILSVGHLIERKGFQYIIEAIDILVNKHGHRDLLLLIIGEGVCRKRLEVQIKKSLLEDHVKLLGAKDYEEIPEWFNVSDIFCLASSSEGWPNVLFEALASGNPVVATDVGGINEVICSEDYGILVKNRTGEDIMKALEAALKKNWDRKKITGYARDNTWDKVGRKVYDVLTAVCPGDVR